MHGFLHPRKDDFVLTFLLLIPSEDELQAMWTCAGNLRGTLEPPQMQYLLVIGESHLRPELDRSSLSRYALG